MLLSLEGFIRPLGLALQASAPAPGGHLRNALPCVRGERLPAHGSAPSTRLALLLRRKNVLSSVCPKRRSFIRERSAQPALWSVSLTRSPRRKVQYAQITAL